MYFLEYIWVDAQGFTRSKLRTNWSNDPFNLSPQVVDVPELPISYHDLPITVQNEIPVWNFDGSSTGQNFGSSTEVLLVPVKVYRSPFLTQIPNYLVLCELSNLQESTHNERSFGSNFNNRSWASLIEDKFRHYEPLFGLEQEYTLLDPQTNLPFNWQESGGETQGPYYCSTRYPYCQLDQMVRSHYTLCALTGIKIGGINAEVCPSQWEFQIGPGPLLQVADDLIMARYLLFRLSTEYRVKVSFHPKPRIGDWNGSGCHINFSTNKTRSGYNSLLEIIQRLEKDHPRILEFYGVDNHLRLTGQHETSSINEFSWGVGTRHTSVRIPDHVFKEQSGYLEDRRPASNLDPYLALAYLLDTVCSETNDDVADNIITERGITGNIYPCPFH